VTGVNTEGMLRSLQRRLIYLPLPTPPPPASSVLPQAREVTLRTSDGLRLGAWFVPASGHAAVLVANGNAGDRALRAPLAESLAAQGLAVLLFDYRGYGGNPGQPSEQGLAWDIRAARQYLIDDAGIPPDRQIYYGESLGAAVITELAAHHPPAALVLRSPFVDLASVGQKHFPFLPVRTLLRDRFPLADYLARVTCPTTVVYGTADSVVPAEQSLTVARAAPETRTVAVRDADHNDLALLTGTELIDAIVALADERIPR
jgi:fermentation-respiration switch protein FrsA (DUF1100 family)